GHRRAARPRSCRRRLFTTSHQHSRRAASKSWPCDPGGAEPARRPRNWLHWHDQVEGQLLLARYGDWLQVQTAEGQAGWVLGEYLTIGPGVMQRVEAVTSVPDPNPALIGRTSERNVNLR